MMVVGVAWILWILVSIGSTREAQPRRILVDTDANTDDIFALFYLLKQNRAEIDLQGITISTNGWTDAGHAVNHIYDILFMMDRDDIPVGVGGEGGISPNGTILPNVGGYLPLIDQEMSTAGECRYTQAIPLGKGGRQDINSNYGLRKGYLPQGKRKYRPLGQPTAQQVMINAVSEGPITVFLMGTHTNFALFLMNNRHLKKNIEHIYAMGGAVRPDRCGGRIGNLFPEDSNPYAEYNIFSDPLATYLVLHSGIPITLIPLDATGTIPISERFFSEFERKQDTYEAKYCLLTLKLIRDTWVSNKFHEQYCMWDSFMVGVAVSIMRNSRSDDGENEFAEMEYMNITVVTSNEPYGISDGSNPLTQGKANANFNVQKNGVHSGHVQMGMLDPFCFRGGKGKCQDGYTKEVKGSEAVSILVATEAKPSNDIGSLTDKQYYDHFLDVINHPEQKGRFNIRTQFPYYKEVLYKPEFEEKLTGKPVVFDMDMSAGDFLALLYLLKLPVELINLKGVLTTSSGWATSATVDVVYDILHMMGRDDIPVGLGDPFSIGQAYPFPDVATKGDCKYRKAIPQGSGGFLDSDTLYGLARDLPRSPRRYTAENSVKFGALRDTNLPELRQPLALDVWKSIVESLDPGSKITILTNGPLTNLAQIISLENTSSVIRDIYIVGGHIAHDNEKGNLFTIPSNEYAEFNVFLDPLAAKAVFESNLDITLIPLSMQRRVSSFHEILNKMQFTDPPEIEFARHLLSRLWRLQQENHRYHHMDMFLGEILGAVILAGNPNLDQTFKYKPLKILADGDVSKIGQIVIDERQGKLVRILDSVNPSAYYDRFGKVLRDQRQSAVIGSFDEQARIWSIPPNTTRNSLHAEM